MQAMQALMEQMGNRVAHVENQLRLAADQLAQAQRQNQTYEQQLRALHDRLVLAEAPRPQQSQSHQQRRRIHQLDQACLLRLRPWDQMATLHRQCSSAPSRSSQSMVSPMHT